MDGLFLVLHEWALSCKFIKCVWGDIYLKVEFLLCNVSVRGIHGTTIVQNKCKTILVYVIPVYGAVRIMYVLDSDDVLFSSMIIYPYIILKHKWYSVWGKRLW